jgi:lipopolysaccharide export system permease protein
LQAVERIAAEARREADLGSIEPGRFTEVGPHNAVVYGERILADGSMENVFLQRRLADGVVEVVVARSGEQVESDNPDVRYLVLRDGRRYEGVPGTTQFRVVEFAEHGIPYRLPSLDPEEPKPRAMSFFNLLRAGGLEHIAEMQWRIGVPLATIILAILAVPLARTQPRAGRYGRLAIGLLIFIIYLNMLSASKAWIEQGSVSPLLGLWWVHGAMLLLALGMLGVQNSVHKRLLS